MHRLIVVISLWLCSALVAGAQGPAASLQPGGAPQPRPCPQALAAHADCLGGQDGNGAYYLIARPHRPNGALVVHAHGGPRLTPPAPDDSDEDLSRFAVMVAEGYAWIGSTYRREGYGVRRAAADVEQSRALYWRWFGRPTQTFLHGQSWGGQIAAKTMELYGFSETGEQRYDGVLLTNGVLSGAREAYTFRADLRAIYQFYCRNHPRPDEPQYPLWRGLPDGATMTRDDLRARIESCTGLSRPAHDRAPAQAAALANILAASGVRETALLQHLAWATFTFPSVVRLAGGNPFDNVERRYRGTNDDDALNAGVVRFSADPIAAARIAHESEPSGWIAVPVISLHASDDPIASAALQASYARRIAAAGREHLLLAIRFPGDDHSRLPPDLVAAALSGLRAWSSSGVKPTPAAIAALCDERASQPAQCATLSTP